MAYDAYLDLEQVLQRISTLDFDRLGEMPGPLWDLAEDLETVLGPDEAGNLASFLNQRIDEWGEATTPVDEWEGER